jgi:glycosyltransferase involved in cell wall biosynthesis
VVFVNEETKAMFQLKKQDVYVQNAFLPPFDIEETLPVEVIKWFDNQKERYIFCANGWKLTYHKGEDLYGLDLCIELVKRLIDQGINCSLIFTISKLNSEGILEKNLQKIQEYNLTDYIYISTCSLPFIEVIKKSAIVLRPTNTDGDALTIREALFFGKKVVASDVVKRPEGTIVFKTRDIKDFVAIVKNTLFEKTPIISNTDKLLAFYKNLYEEN